jgi:predicted nuclease of predicted toxin-antitoxin system
MKLLFDQNLAASLVNRLADIFPGSSHVKTAGLERADDDTIWAHAREHGFTLVSKDSDFQQRSLFHGSPPKFIWLKCGNCPTSRIEGLLREHSARLHTFASEAEESHLILS